MLQDVSLKIHPGQHTILKGASGSGKSTLLHLIGLLDHPKSGQLWLDSKNTMKLTDAERTKLRSSMIGVIYQFHHLLPELSAIENTAFPLVIAGTSWRKAIIKAKHLLSQVGLCKRFAHKPNELSGGERQRVAIARALIHTPKLLIADEPTGSLDAQTSAQVMNLVNDLLKEHSTTLLMATHNAALISNAFRTYELKDGRLE